MASCQTTRWVSTSPYVKLTVTQSASDGDSVDLAWTLQYISDYAADTNGARPYSVVIDGATVASGTYDIDGVTGTKTIASGTKKNVAKSKTGARNVSFSCSFQFNLTWSGSYKGTLSASSNISVAKRTSYTITYDANGGSSAPSSQTKWYGENITLAAAISRTGYSFQGWGLTTSSVTYKAKATYSTNASDTLYAIWKANTYTVTYNANGGTNAPSSQTKTHGVTLTLSTDVPKRTNYNFIGWARSASATTKEYDSGGQFKLNANTTLYALWELAYIKPEITNLEVSRYSPIVNEEGTIDGYEPNDEGTYANVSFDWKCDRAVTSMTVEWKSVSGSSGSKDIPFSGTSGRVSEIFGEGILDTDSSYTVHVKIVDSVDYSEQSTTLNGTIFPIDALVGNKGVSFGKPAELENVTDSNWTIYPRKGFINIVLEAGTNIDEVLTPNTYVGLNVSSAEYAGTFPPITSGTFTLEVVGAGNEGQVKQTFTSTHKTDFQIWSRHYYSSSWGNWTLVYAARGSLLASPRMFMTAGHNVPLSRKVSEQPNGIVLVFSAYNDGAVRDYWWASFFIPKYVVTSHNGTGHSFMLASNPGITAIGFKYLYIHDDHITGHDANSKTGTSKGITYANNSFVLRYVIGV